MTGTNRTAVRLLVPALLSALLVALTPGVSSARIAPAPGDHTIKVVSQRTYSDETGFHIYADLKNRTRSWRTKVRATVMFYNSAGKRIFRSIGYPEQSYVAPRGHMSFHFYRTTVPPGGYHHYKITFTSKKARKKRIPAKRLRVAVGKVAPDPVIGGLNVPVTVTNRNHRKVRHVAVYVTLFDGAGRILTTYTGYNYTSPSVLKPRRSGAFTAYFGSRFDGVRRVNVMVEAKIRR